MRTRRPSWKLKSCAERPSRLDASRLDPLVKRGSRVRIPPPACCATNARYTVESRVQMLKNAGSPVVLAAFGLALGVAAPASADVAPPSNKEPYVVFTVGDSYAAGEGAPEIPGNYDDKGHLPFFN